MSKTNPHLAAELHPAHDHRPTTNLPSLRRNPGNAGNVGRLALTKAEAAESLGLSVDSFDRYVAPELRIVRRGRCRLIAVRELEAWLTRSASSLMEDLA